MGETNPGTKSGGVAVEDNALLSASRVRCCICGVMTNPNAANTCINCLKSQIDITEGIPRSLLLNHCRDCNRYERPPFVQVELESAELLALCLKNIKGLKRVKLLDAAFVWTEPHSRRIKVKLTVQQEVQQGALL
jgi:nonsense-mediated mRNA decay protein 3